MLGLLMFEAAYVMAQNTIQVSAPVTTDLAGKTATQALASVFRIIDTQTGMGGSGFLHSSGRVITAAHVVASGDTNRLKIILSTGEVVDVCEAKLNHEWDLALLKPSKKIGCPCLPITKTTEIPVGAQVATWGFPMGYSGLIPLLTVGYVSGVDLITATSGQRVPRFVINAAFNSGNSGGPLISLDDGSVIGVVSSKLAPVPPYIISALEALKNQQSGFAFTARTSDGKEKTLTEGQVIAEVLTYLRSQTQLVIGYAVSTAHLLEFLKQDETKK
jgi:S1-C subfamily serine protease